MNRNKYSEVPEHIDHYRSLAFWSWNGKMDKDEMCRQIDGFAENGYGGFFIHSRAGLEIPYMEDEWFKAYETAVLYAEKTGLTVWIYDEDGWPSGFAGGIVSTKGDAFTFKRVRFAEGDAVNSDLVQKNLIAACQRNGKDLAAYYESDSHYVDLLNPDVTRAFIESTHEVYKRKLGHHFGKTIKGCFSDEPQLNNFGYTWSTALPDFYRKETGRDLLEDIWMIPDPDPQYDSIRLDYWKVIGKLFKESFTDIIAKWCKNNGLLFTGHFAAEDGLCDQISSNGGVMQMYPSMQLPGIDHLGKRLASPVLMKQISSVAEQYGKDRVLSESFGCSGWNLSFEDMVWIWGYQAALGINLPCLHLSAYTIKGVRKRDYPVFFSHQEPWWDKFRLVNDYFAALNTLLSGGASDSDTLVVLPLTGMWMKALRPGHSEDEINISAQYRILIENLLNLQISFDLGDERLMEEDAVVRDGFLRIGNSSYRRLIISQTPLISSEVAGICEKFLQEKGEIICINTAPQNFKKCNLVQNRRDMLRKYFDCTGMKREIVFKDKNSDKIASDILVRTRIYDDRKIVYIWNGSTDSERSFVAEVEGNPEVSLISLCENALIKEELVKSSRNDSGTSFGVSVPPKGSRIISLKNMTRHGVLNVQPESLISKEAVKITQTKLTEDNSLTLDRAAYSIDGAPFTSDLPVIHMQDHLYKIIESKNEPSKITVRYVFEMNLSEQQTNRKIYLAAESEDFGGLRLNGVPINNREEGHWIDGSIRKFSIGDLCVKGRNTFDMDCKMPVWQPVSDVEEVFETERNRFHYPVGIEAVYILGDFRIYAGGKVTGYNDHIRIMDASFTITDSMDVSDTENMIAEGLWFYRGNYVAEYDFMSEAIEKGARYYAGFENKGFILAEIYLNNNCIASMFTPPYETDITDYLREGLNSLKIKYYGSNRNLFGPHHHIKGEPSFVGPSTFIGKRGYEDFVSPEINSSNTWTDDYSFVRTDISKFIYISKYKYNS
ncbi:MAG: glycosyl hydrolase [Saccharofermentanales bacterium]